MVQIDLSFAFHTDAGTPPNDSIIGTLSIYTLLCDGSDKFANGEDRLQQRMYADFVQTEIVNDIRKEFNPEWSRRGLWDRSYSESRTATVPAMLLELLSHQNFADMKFGLDPSFRFTVSRAVYKGMLKYLSARYGCEYAVQPLPVNSFATSFTGSKSVRLSWKATVDSLEATAVPTGYILQTRIDDGAFDNGRVLDGCKVSGNEISTKVSIVPGHIYSYRVTAFNKGGKSFPSETLSVGIPESGNGKNVLVVNNFTRVSAPAWFDSNEYAGFDLSTSSAASCLGWTMTILDSERPGPTRPERSSPGTRSTTAESTARLSWRPDMLSTLRVWRRSPPTGPWLKTMWPWISSAENRSLPLSALARCRTGSRCSLLAYNKPSDATLRMAGTCSSPERTSARMSGTGSTQCTRTAYTRLQQRNLWRRRLAIDG